MVPKLIHGILGILIGALLVGLFAGSAALTALAIFGLLIGGLIVLKLILLSSGEQGQQLVVFTIAGILIGAVLALLGLLSPATVADGNGWMFVALIVLALAL